MHMYIYLCTYVYIYMHVYKYIHAYKCIHIYKYVCIVYIRICFKMYRLDISIYWCISIFTADRETSCRP